MGHGQGVYRESRAPLPLMPLALLLGPLVRLLLLSRPLVLLPLLHLPCHRRPLQPRQVGV